VVDVERFRLVDEVTDLDVEREPHDADITVTHRQSELAKPETCAV